MCFCVCVCVCVCVYQRLASACPFRLRLSHLPVEGRGDVTVCIHVWCVHVSAPVRVHNMCRCEEVLYLYQLLLVITH